MGPYLFSSVPLLPCVGPCCRRCFWPSSAVVCHGGFPSRQTITQNRPVPGLPPWCIRRWFPPDVKSPLVGVPKETSCLGLPSRRFLPCSPAWCDSVAAGSWEVVPLSVLCVCCQPSIELLLCCRDHEQACLSCASDYMVILRLSSWWRSASRIMQTVRAPLQASRPRD